MPDEGRWKDRQVVVRSTLTQEKLKEILDYDSENGVWTWLRPTSNRVKRGDIAGKRLNNGYTYIGVQGKLIAAHRLAFLWFEGRFPEDFVDHINRERSDNRWSNLRKATQSENLRNGKIKITNTTGARNVSKKDGGYRVRLQVGGRELYVGIYPDLELAQLVADEARDLYYGQFA